MYIFNIPHCNPKHSFKPFYWLERINTIFTIISILPSKISIWYPWTKIRSLVLVCTFKYYSDGLCFCFEEFHQQCYCTCKYAVTIQIWSHKCSWKIIEVLRHLVVSNFIIISSFLKDHYYWFRKNYIICDQNMIIKYSINS